MPWVTIGGHHVFVGDKSGANARDAQGLKQHESANKAWEKSAKAALREDPNAKVGMPPRFSGSGSMQEHDKYIAAQLDKAGVKHWGDAMGRQIEGTQDQIVDALKKSGHIEVAPSGSARVFVHNDHPNTEARVVTFYGRPMVSLRQVE